MTSNPFIVPSLLDGPLDGGLCRDIHYAAVRRAAGGEGADSIPVTVSPTSYRHAARLCGPGAYLAHPGDIECIFRGVTLTVYRAIESLYCSRLGRSIYMVWRILTAMAEVAHRPVVSYEAVWALCLHLEDRRRQSIGVTIARRSEIWRLGVMQPDVRLVGRAGTAYVPTVTYIVEMDPDRVLAFAVSDAASGVHTRGVLHDAIAAQRQPTRNGPGNLRWSLPAHLQAGIDLDDECRRALREMGIILDVPADETPLEVSLRGDWTRDLRQQSVPEARFAPLLNTYLRRVHGYGPVRVRADTARRFAGRRGYERDPAGQLPALRHLLPQAVGVIGADGAVAHDGLHYTHDLLAYWCGQEVILRRSRESEATAWVYLDGAALCQAMARELRRADGSYRSRRHRQGGE